MDHNIGEIVIVLLNAAIEIVKVYCDSKQN